MPKSQPLDKKIQQHIDAYGGTEAGTLNLFLERQSSLPV